MGERKPDRTQEELLAAREPADGRARGATSRTVVQLLRSVFLSKAMLVLELAALVAVAGIGWAFVRMYDTGATGGGVGSVEPTAAGVARSEPARDWPQWRGAQRDGVARGVELLPVWPPGGPPQVWRVPGGGGYSSVVVADGRAITMLSRGGDELVVALDAHTGRTLWSVRSDADRFDPFGSGPRSTPVVAGDRIFTLGASGSLTCLEAATGRILWRVRLHERFGGSPMRYGHSGSPLIEADRLLINVGAPGASIVAFDTRDGRVLWTALADRAGYASPIAIDVDGVRQAVFLTAAGLVGIGPVDGRLLWRVPWVTFDDCNVATPIWSAEHRLLFVSTAHDRGCAAIRLSARDGVVSAEIVWENKAMRNRIGSSVLVDGFLYGLDGDWTARLKCVELATGRERWADRSVGRGSLIAADGRLLVLGESGEPALVAADPAGYREIARCKVLTGNKCWATPSLADGRLYLRDEREIVCLQVGR
jgi:outer membrane protein assembly factor BamB